MNNSVNKSTYKRSRLIRVTAMEDLSYLVKEQELMSGQPGRNFFVGKRQVVVFSIHSQGSGFDVRKIGPNAANEAQYFTDPQIEETAIGKALRNGTLYTFG